MLIAKWMLFATVIPVAAYGLHHVCLWLERRGLLYYKHKQPSSSPMGCLVGLQKAIAPSIEHVIHAKHEKRRSSEEAAPGDDPQ
jgi:hypothetical protein